MEANAYSMYALVEAEMWQQSVEHRYVAIQVCGRESECV